MISEFFKDKRPHNGLTYDEYFQAMQQHFEGVNIEDLNEEEKEQFEITPLNIQRSGRINRTYQVPESLCQKIREINEPQLWMVLSEPWCGDSAQMLPYINKFAQCNPKINLRILLRDENLNIMGQYLIDGAQSIPLWVAFDEDGKELFKWGSRPKEASELFARGKAAGLTKHEILPRLHLWYGRNRGKAIELEFHDLLGKVFHHQVSETE